MTDAHAPAAHAHAHPHHGYEAKFYVKMWAVLCILLVISVFGPFIGIRWVTLLTAFGIAIVKAYLVCAYFMHLKLERKYAVYLLITVLLLLGLFWGGVAGDVMNHQGQHWNNVAAKEETARAMRMIQERGAGGHGAAHGEKKH